MEIKHPFVNLTPDGVDTSIVRPSDWNDAHTMTVSATDKVIGRASSGAGAAEEIPCTAAGRTLLAAADAAAQRTALGVGTGSGDVVGTSVSVDSEIALFDSTTGKAIKRATGTGFVKVSSGVMQAPAATVGRSELDAATAQPAEVLLSEHVVPAGGEASVTFSSIAATYRDLRIVVRGRGTASATFVRPRVRFNADTGNNYNWNRHTGHGTTTEAETAAGVAFIDTGVIPAATATASFAGSVDIRVFDYRGTAFFHSVIAACHGWAVSEHYVMNGGGLWKSASAISSVTLLLDSGNYAEGSVISLYGIY